MPLNPANFTNPSEQSLGTGRPASPTRMNNNVVGPMSHIAGRRMGIYTISPTSPTGGGASGHDYWEWTSNGLTGGYYRTHGLFLETDTYDDVAEDMWCGFCGFTKDQGVNATTVHFRLDVRYLESPSLFPVASFVSVDIEQNYGDNSSTDPAVQTYSFADIGTSFSGQWRRGVQNNIYDPEQYNGMFGDCGAFQFTTRDLCSVSKYLGNRYGVTNLISRSDTNINRFENKQAMTNGSVTCAAPTGTNSANYTRTIYYYPSFTAYPNDIGGI